MEFFENLEPLLRGFWFIAIPASLIFIVQAIMTFLGSDASDGVDADFDGDFEGHSAPFQLFSLRNMINFLLGFSWTGISFYESISSHFILITLATVVGLVFVYMFFVIIQQIKKLAEDNTFKLSDTIYKTADVYLTIPGNRSGKGKILVTIKGSTRELDAITPFDQIDNGSLVKIIDIESDNLLIVEPI